MQTRCKSETGRRFFGRVASALVRFVVVVFFAILFFHLFVHGEEDFVRGTERGEPQTRQPPRRRCRQRSSKPGKKNKTKQKQNAVLVEPTPSPPPRKKSEKKFGRTWRRRTCGCRCAKRPGADAVAGEADHGRTESMEEKRNREKEGSKKPNGPPKSPARDNRAICGTLATKNSVKLGRWWREKKRTRAKRGKEEEERK